MAVARRDSVRPRDEKGRGKILRQGSFYQELLNKDETMSKVNGAVDIPRLTFSDITARTEFVNSDGKRPGRPVIPRKNTVGRATSLSQGADFAQQRRLPLVIYDENYLGGRKNRVKPGLEGKRTFLPILSSTLEVKRMNIREKDGLNNLRRQVYKPATRKGHYKRQETGQPLEGVLLKRWTGFSTKIPPHR
ncbi:hypothetical protein pdam_00008121 [Pocillopora damicornis]|uniref:Uncharacterized protein n=1 Tax=Pocillopora damicornis TaxID=46731 RepID=A0A3M6UDI5_POCDA|nr:hypothetical protein pdam_00008121 [Pocillopora damicornis]